MTVINNPTPQYGRWLSPAESNEFVGQCRELSEALAKVAAAAAAAKFIGPALKNMMAQITYRGPKAHSAANLLRKELQLFQAQYLPAVLHAVMRMGVVHEYTLVWDASKRRTRRGRQYMPVHLVAAVNTEDIVAIDGPKIGERRWRRRDQKFFTELGFYCALVRDSSVVFGFSVPSYDASGTRSGRLNASRPNTTNVPKSQAMGRGMRYVPTKSP